jgi:hypothetical protein
MAFGEEAATNPLSAATKQWFDLWRTASAWGWGAPGLAPFLGNPKQLRNLWLTDLSRAFDGYMRSRVFLEAMQYNLGAMTRATRLMYWLPPR